jgi:hypothetical protein
MTPPCLPYVLNMPSIYPWIRTSGHWPVRAGTTQSYGQPTPLDLAPGPLLFIIPLDCYNNSVEKVGLPPFLGQNQNKTWKFRQVHFPKFPQVEPKLRL